MYFSPDDPNILTLSVVEPTKPVAKLKPVRYEILLTESVVLFKYLPPVIAMAVPPLIP